MRPSPLEENDSPRTSKQKHFWRMKVLSWHGKIRRSTWHLQHSHRKMSGGIQGKCTTQVPQMSPFRGTCFPLLSARCASRPDETSWKSEKISWETFRQIPLIRVAVQLWKKRQVPRRRTDHRGEDSRVHFRSMSAAGKSGAGDTQIFRPDIGETIGRLKTKGGLS